MQVSHNACELLNLPLRVALPLSDTTLVGAGWDGQVYVFDRPSSGAAWKLQRQLAGEQTLALWKQAQDCR